MMAHLSRMTCRLWSLPRSAAIPKADSHVLLDPPHSSCETLTHPRPEATRRSAKVLLPLPGRPTRTSSLGSFRPADLDPPPRPPPPDKCCPRPPTEAAGTVVLVPLASGSATEGQVPALVESDPQAVSWATVVPAWGEGPGTKVLGESPDKTAATDDVSCEDMATVGPVVHPSTAAASTILACFQVLSQSSGVCTWPRRTNLATKRSN